MDSKDEMLGRIRAALGRAKPQRPQPLAAFTSRPVAADCARLAHQFQTEVEKIGGHVTFATSDHEVTRCLEGLMPAAGGVVAAVSDSATASRMGLRDWFAGRNASMVSTLGEFDRSGASSAGVSFEDNSPAEPLMERYKKALIDASMGVTSADYALADTGTLVLVSGGEQHRLISLVPPVHICLLDKSRILPNLADLLTRVQGESYADGKAPLAMTFITGPSRTADIELTLTMGVHGPRELHVIIHS